MSAKDYELWKVQHKPDCSANYSSSALAVEREADVRLLTRSVARHNLRYLEYIGDDDCEGVSYVVAAVPYGLNVAFEE